MLLKPFQCSHFSVDIAKGNILSETGDILLIGRPRGLRHAGRLLCDDDFEPITSSHVRNRSLSRYKGSDLSWRQIYSFRYRAHRRRRDPPRSPDDFFFHYIKLRLDLELFLWDLHLSGRLAGYSKLGLTGLSWRAPRLAAHAIAEALASLYTLLLRNPRTNIGLTTVIRSLDEPHEFRQAFDPEYYADFIEQRGFTAVPRHVWHRDSKE